MQSPEQSNPNRVNPNGQKSVQDSPATADSPAAASQAPSLNLPKGGGAIRGIGEKFQANPFTGTGSLTVPVFTSPGRSGFGPQLLLSYNSAGGNSPYGFGWSLDLPAITRKTDKGLPQYADYDDSDIFILSGAEDLMPGLVQTAGQWTKDITPSRTLFAKQYAIHRYRPRVEGAFARIERWINLSDPTDAFWRSITRDNVTTWYGQTSESRIADPLDPSRIFSWLISQSYDDKGNLIVYKYKAENLDGVDLTQANERNRSRTANRYVKHIFYGNRTPYLPDLALPAAIPLPPDTDFCFETVFDYGEHDLANPVPTEAQLWDCRLDPFSSYRAAFEVRTYRLCRRVLMFHHFAAEANIGINCLGRSTDLTHTPPAPPSDPSQPFYSFLLSVAQTGYVRNGAVGYLSNSLPPLEFEYTQPVVDETVREVDTDSMQNLPYGLDGSHYRWTDLDGEGVSGILTEQAGGWFYKANLSPVNQQTVDGAEFTLARFAPVELVARRPSLTALSGGNQQLLDLSGDGRLDLVEFGGPTPGFFERTANRDWTPFATFPSLPDLDWQDPNLKFIDLTGDGLTDILISEDDAFWWHTALGTDGFGPAQRVPQALDEETGPKLVFSDSTESVFLADISGDGLIDLVRIRNGEVCYWPNLGYGRFGAKVTMDQSPWFDRRDLFDGKRLRLADIDGSGTADIIYFAANAVHLYFNQSGNAWGARRVLAHFPALETLSSATAIDLLGNGTSCLVWSSPLAGNVRRAMRYIDLMGGQKPHLMVHLTNNLGSETRVQYAPSTKFYVADKLAGTPWVTRLPFPLQVVEQVQVYDFISRNLFVTRYSYHHGYFDSVEREFRGFGRVEQFDTEEFATLSNSTDFPQADNVDSASNVPPVFTKTWFHTGAFFGENRISNYLQHEYYTEGDASDRISGLTSAQSKAMLLPDTVLPRSVLLPDDSSIAYDLSGEEMREACRALRGSILRQEIFADDATDTSDRPYSVSERNYTIEVFQPQGPNPYAVFYAHAREVVDFHYERTLYTIAGPPAQTVADPRVTHILTLAVDAFGNVKQSVSIAYGRRHPDTDLSPADQAIQAAILSTYKESSFTNAVTLDDSYRARAAAQSSTYELIQLTPPAPVTGITTLFRFGDIQKQVQQASDGLHDIEYENLHPAALNPGETYRRLFERKRTLYRPDDMGAAAANPRALLGLGVLQSLALPGQNYRLAFTPGLITQVYLRGAAALLPTPATVLGSTAIDGGGYIDLDGDLHWWIPSERTFYLPTAPTSPAENNQARQHFFLPRRFENPFGSASTVDYEVPHDLLPLTTTDAAGNIITAVNDYRVLVPSMLTDANNNRAAVSFDALGLVVANAVMGKVAETLGDLLTGFSPDLTQAQIDAFYSAADPHNSAAPLLGNATSRIVYDVHRFQNSRAAAPADPTKWQPSFAATLARETHFFDLASGAQSKIQIGVSFSDGLGREIQKKVQAEPGPVVDGGPVLNPRWVGSGWTIFNNKGNPVRQYEPFFSQLPAAGHQFEFGVEVGVSPILCYDPVGRNVATIHANHSYEKVVFDPWRKFTWDVNDTVSQDDPTTDPDVGDFFKRLPAADYSPTWRVQRAAGDFGPQEQAAAAKTVAHANTPAVAYYDTLGRGFLTIADDAAAGKFLTHSELDIQNKQRSVTDALNRRVMVYDFDLPGNHIHQASMESGERWMLDDVLGRSIRSFDSRGHNFRTTYDALRRPVGLFVLGTDPANSDPRTTAAEVLCETSDYGEGQPSDQALNLRGRIFQQHDTSGLLTNQAPDPVTGVNAAFDFKGNLVATTRRFVDDYKALPNWSLPAPALLADVLIGITRYDALNRVLSATMPDNTVLHPAYNEANLLQALDVNVLGAAAAASFVTNIDYNAKAQRIRIDYGNGATTTYSYDPLTFRLAELTTTRPGFPANQQTVQDLIYTYDPVGNVNHIQDNADTQNVIYFNNRRVEPSTDFIYDAVYRLIQAVGREQLGLAAGSPLAPAPTSYNDAPRVQLFQPGDGNAMGLYNETYQYDAAGNFVQCVHRGANPASPGWTRSYSYNQASQLEPAKFNNQLTRTTVSGGVPFNEDYSSDLHGNMTAMPQLQLVNWDFKDRLQMTQRQAVNASDADGKLHQGQRTFYVYNSSGDRVRKTTESAAGVKMKERYYLGPVEIYREYTGGAVSLERKTLHVLDDKRRVAIVESKTIDPAAPPRSLPSSATRFQYDNHLGTACLELDDTAEVISYEEYYPYGSTSYQAGRTLAEVSLKRYRFTGKERDEESGLYYHGARYCAPWIGRWISCDPSGIGPDLNLYACTGDNPVRYRDPDGRDGQDQNNPQGQDNPAPGKAQPAKTQNPGKKEDSSSKASKAPDAKDDKDEEEKGPPDVTSYLFTAVQSAGEVTNNPEKGEPVNRLVVEALLSQTVLKDKLSASQVEALVRTVNQTRAIGLSVQVQGNLSGDSKGDYTITVGGIYHAFRNHDDKRNTPEEKATGVDVGVYVQPIVTVAHSGNDTSVSVGGTITGALSTDLIDDTLTLDLNASGSLFTSSQLTDNKTTLSPGGSYAFNAGLTYKFGKGWQIPLEGSVTYTSGYAQTPNATVPNTSSTTSSTRFTGGLGVGKLGAFGLKFLGAEINVTNEAIHPPFFAPSATKVPSGGLNIIGVF